MAILSRPSSAPGTSLTYITIGSLTAIWSVVWYWGFQPSRSWSFVCFGLFVTGLVFLLIGFTIGQIGRAARTAELPPSEVTPAAVQAHQAAANRQGTAQPAAPAPQVPGVTTTSSVIQT